MPLAPLRLRLWAPGNTQYHLHSHIIVCSQSSCLGHIHSSKAYLFVLIISFLVIVPTGPSSTEAQASCALVLYFWYECSCTCTYRYYATHRPEDSVYMYTSHVQVYVAVGDYCTYSTVQYDVGTCTFTCTLGDCLSSTEGPLQPRELWFSCTCTCTLYLSVDCMLYRIYM